MALPAAMILSGIPREHFKDLQDIYIHGEKLTRSPSSSSIASNGTASSYHSMESGISSLSNESSATAKSLSHLDMLTQFEVRLEEHPNELKTEDECESEPAQIYSYRTELEINYNSRNLLDLLGNIRSPLKLQPAVLRQGVANFLENRSQFSRVGGVGPPRHLTITCTEEDCNFQEPHYF